MIENGLAEPRPRVSLSLSLSHLCQSVRPRCKVMEAWSVTTPYKASIR